MPDVNFQINTPVLLAGQKFKTRYRLLPAGAWSANTDRTNAAFTITGLSAGMYELEAILVLADETECAPTYWKFTVLDPVECLDFTVEIVQLTNGLYALEIDYSLPSPVYNPPCGWQIIHAGGTAIYPTLPTPPIQIPTQNVGQQVRIVANGCGENTRECFNGDVASITPICTPIVVNTASMVVNGIYPNGDYGMSLVVTFTQSTPATKYLTIVLNQTGVLSGAPGQTSYPNFSFGPIPTTNTGFSIPIVANKNVGKALDGDLMKLRFTFSYLIVDGCNKTHNGTVEILV